MGVGGVSGQNVRNHAVEDGGKEVVQVQHLHMEELIVQKDMDLEIKRIATRKNALSMEGGVTGVSAVKNVVEDGGKEVVQVQHLHMEELIAQKDMDLEIKRIATKKVAMVATTKWDAQESCGAKLTYSKCLLSSINTLILI